MASAAVKAAIAKAQQAAEEVVETQQTAEVHQLPATQNTSVPATAPAAGKRFSMGDLAGGTLSVDKWIKVNENGLKIGDSPLTEELVVSLEMTEGRGFLLKKAIKFGQNPPQYYYTKDGVLASCGGSWEAAVAKAFAADPRPQTREYPCVDLPFTLEEPALDMKGKTIAEAGTKLGYTTSTTNWKNWENFYYQVEEAGLMGCRVLAKLTAQVRKANGNTWGVIAFELLGEAGGEE